MKLRKPAQAGSFYAGTKTALLRQIEECFNHSFGPGKLPSVNTQGKRQIVGLICPHAGYMYSGPVAANSFFELSLDGKIDTAIIIGPNHTGMGSGVSLMSEGFWETPLGTAEIDAEIADRIVANSRIIDVEEMAHKYEHSIEVEIPFLQYVYGTAFKLVPICMMLQDLQTSIEVAEAVAEAIRDKNAVIIGSTDFTHYEPHSSAEKKDRKAIETILKLDETELQRVVETENISMCGYGPATATVRASKLLGGKTASFLCYKTSGDITGDKSAVVGYSAVKITT